MFRFRNAFVLSAALALSVGCLIGRPAVAADWKRAGLAESVTRDGACTPILAPPRRLETISKYDQAIGSKSVIDEDAAALRRNALAPTEAAIRSLAKLAEAQHVEWAQAGTTTSATCLKRSIEAWAAAAAMTDMRSKDANLTRDKFMASIGETLLSVRHQGVDPKGIPSLSEWLSLIARQTTEFYDLQAGPISRSNNHRYWAGLAIGRIGLLVDDRSMLEWSKNSLENGLCQIDDEGFLPLEIARGAKAYDYHLYAFVALQSLADLLSAEGAAQAECAKALPRLAGLVERGENAFVLRTGHRQDRPSRKNLFAIANLQARAAAGAKIDY